MAGRVTGTARNLAWPPKTEGELGQAFDGPPKNDTSNRIRPAPFIMGPLAAHCRCNVSLGLARGQKAKKHRRR